MKRYLFIDNFRGFSKTYIPIVDVNFLVGENSSGKTSVLGLLKRFSDPRVLLGKDFFTDEDVTFGNFQDMVSAHSEDRNHFSIGLIDEQPNRRRASNTSSDGMLLTYTERGGLPKLSMLSRTMGTRCVHLAIKEQHTSYKVTDLPRTVSTAEAMARTVMPNWLAEHHSDGAKYKVLSVPKELENEALPLLLSLSVAAQPPGKGSKGISFSGPPWFPPELAWVAPIRSKPRRTYDELQSAFSSEGSHTPYLIKRILDSEPQKSKFESFIEKAGLASGLFQSIKIKPFGAEVTAPFELDAVLDDKPLNLSTVGYGVSQSLPIFVELFARTKESVFAIQQPEVHLHPRAQAALGDVFFDMAVTDKKGFLIETHSDFTIDRFRMNYRKKGVRKPDSQVLFFERRNKGNTVTPLPIDSNGDLPSEQPESYRSFFVREEMRLLGL